MPPSPASVPRGTEGVSKLNEAISEYIQVAQLAV